MLKIPLLLFLLRYIIFIKSKILKCKYVSFIKETCLIGTLIKEQNINVPRAPNHIFLSLAIIQNGKKFKFYFSNTCHMNKDI